MTTKRERGRDPEQHVVHAGYMQANAYTGMHGEITGVAGVDPADGKRIVELRFHNGLLPGGYVVPLIPWTEVRSPLTFASVPPTFAAPAEDTLLISHELGYYPLVQVLDSDGNLMPMEQIVVAPVSVDVAGPASNDTNDHTHAVSSDTVEASSVTLTKIYDVIHHDVENLSVVNYTDSPLTVLLR